MSTPDAPLAPSIPVRHDDTVPVLVIPDEPGFDALRDLLREAMPAVTAELGGRASRLDLGNRSIKLFDLRRLTHLLADEFGVQITGLYVRRREMQLYAERELKLKLFPTDEPVENAADNALVELTDAPATAAAAEEAPVADTTAETDTDGASAEEAGPALPDDLLPAAAPSVEELAAPSTSTDPGRRTLVLHRTLRSGTTVRFEGDVTIFGDVNPGAQVTASGNVLVLGSFKGMAHVGATGDESAFLLAFDLDPTQLRIARRIAVLPKSEAEDAPEGTGARLLAMARNIRAEPTSPFPRIAHVVDGAISIQPYRGPLPR
jgi:septum site-determining protein MinC